MPQVSAPSVDVTDGSWTTDTGGSVLYAAIDEAVASDTDYIKSSNLTQGNSDLCEIALGSLTDPISSSNHTLSYRYRAQGTESMNLVVSLMQGATLIASQTHTGVGSSFVDGTLTLSAGEANAITDYTDLRVRFNAVCPAVSGNSIEWGSGNSIEWGSGNAIQWG